MSGPAPCLGPEHKAFRRALRREIIPREEGL